MKFAKREIQFRKIQIQIREIQVKKQLGRIDSYSSRAQMGKGSNSSPLGSKQQTDRRSDRQTHWRVKSRKNEKKRFF